MLLRSSSSPILNSWVAALARDPLPSDVAIDAVRPLRHSRSVTHLSSLPHLSASSSQSSAAHFRFDGFRPRNAGKLSDLSWSDVEEAGEEDASVAESHSVNRFLSCSGLHEDPEAEGVLSPEEAEELWNEYCSLEADGAEGGEDGEGDWLKKGGEDDGAVDVNSAGSGFGKNDGSGGFCSGEGENSSDLDSVATDAMYRQMIEADPSNSLLLRNYAEFLHEVESFLLPFLVLIFSFLRTSRGNVDFQTFVSLIHSTLTKKNQHLYLFLRSSVLKSEKPNYAGLIPSVVFCCETLNLISFRKEYR